MDVHGIDLSVVHALGRTKAELEDSTRNIARLVEKHPDKLAGFASVMPTDKDAVTDFEAYVTEFGFKGLKLHPPLQHFSPADPRLTPLVEKCIELDVPILFHTGGGFMRDGRLAFADPVLLDDLAIQHPQAKIIIAHGNPLGIDPYIAAKHENVYLDTTIAFAKIARLMPNIGPELLDWMNTDEKLIYGSDGFPDHLHYFKYNIEPVLSMPVSEESRAKILGGTAAKLLKLDA
jgi:predicted TIM-barrel fold metal-dependent hydrolase